MDELQRRMDMFCKGLSDADMEKLHTAMRLMHTGYNLAGTDDILGVVRKFEDAENILGEIGCPKSLEYGAILNVTRESVNTATSAVSLAGLKAGAIFTRLEKAIKKAKGERL